MKNLWAPWRMTFIETHKHVKGCVFCRYLRERMNDVKNHVLYRGRTCFVVMNLYPYNNGHLMVMPKRHIGDITKLTKSEYAELMALSIKAVKVIKRVLKPEGYNIGMNIGAVSGAGIADHLHMHIVPRWYADTNFMPVVAGIKVMPQAVDDTYALLVKEFRRK
ncbi:MAG: HIT domain-containing protein [Elusimicrobiota bacterium]